MEVNKRDSIDGLVNGGLFMGGFGSGVDREGGFVCEDDRVGSWTAGGFTGNGGWNTELLDVLADDLLPVDAVNGVLSHTEEEG